MLVNFIFLLLTSVISGNAQQPPPASPPPPGPSPSPAQQPPPGQQPPPPQSSKPPATGHKVFLAGMTAMDSYPKQEKCNQIQAKKLYEAGKSEGKWALVKVTPLPNPPPQQFDYNVNFCSPFSYLPGTCQGVLIRIVEYEDDFSITLQIFAYNSHTKSTIHFANNAQLQDHWYAVYQGVPSLMEEYFDDNRYKLVNPIPQFILDSQSEEFVKVARGGSNKWMAFVNCVSKNAWVLFREDVEIKDLWKYQKEYTEALKALKVDVQAMVDVPIVNNKWDELM